MSRSQIGDLWAVKRFAFATSFLYYAGLSYRDIEPVVERSHEAVLSESQIRVSRESLIHKKTVYHRLSHLFEPETDHRDVVAVDETKLKIDGEQVYVWAAVDVDIFEVIHVDISKCGSSLDALRTTYPTRVVVRCLEIFKNLRFLDVCKLWVRNTPNYSVLGSLPDQ